MEIHKASFFTHKGGWLVGPTLPTLLAAAMMTGSQEKGIIVLEETLLSPSPRPAAV